jgi:hypothetical protein
LNIYCVSGIMLWNGNTSVSKIDKILISMISMICVNERESGRSNNHF